MFFFIYFSIADEGCSNNNAYTFRCINCYGFVLISHLSCQYYIQDEIMKDDMLSLYDLFL